MCTSCSSHSATVCCPLCKEPPLPFCQTCYVAHESSFPDNRGHHYPVPVCFCKWTPLERDTQRDKVYKLALNSARLKELIPSLDGLIHDVNSTYEGVENLLISWRDHHISAFTKCHSAVKEQVNAVIFHVAQQAVDPDFKSSTDLLENFLLTPGSKLLLLKSQLDKSQITLVEASILKVASDLSEVLQTFRREYSGPKFQERVKGFEMLEAELNATQMREEDLRCYFEKAKKERDSMEIKYDELMCEVRKAANFEDQSNRIVVQEESLQMQRDEAAKDRLSWENKYKESLQQMQNEANMRIEDYRSVIAALFSRLVKTTKTVAHQAHKLKSNRDSAVKQEELAKSREEKCSALVDKLVREREEIEAKWIALCEECKKMKEREDLLLQNEKASKERIAELRGINKKADGKKDTTIRDLENQLQACRATISDFRGQDPSRHSIEMRHFAEQHGREAEASSLRGSLRATQSLTTWDCPNCRNCNPIHLQECTICRGPRSVWLCLFCGGYNENIVPPGRQGNPLVSVETPRTVKPKTNLPDLGADFHVKGKTMQNTQRRFDHLQESHSNPMLGNSRLEDLPK